MAPKINADILLQSIKEKIVGHPLDENRVPLPAEVPVPEEVSKERPAHASASRFRSRQGRVRKAF